MPSDRWKQEPWFSYTFWKTDEADMHRCWEEATTDWCSPLPLVAQTYHMRNTVNTLASYFCWSAIASMNSIPHVPALMEWICAEGYKMSIILIWIILNTIGLGKMLTLILWYICSILIKVTYLFIPFLWPQTFPRLLNMTVASTLYICWWQRVRKSMQVHSRRTSSNTRQKKLQKISFDKMPL